MLSSWGDVSAYKSEKGTTVLIFRLTTGLAGLRGRLRGELVSRESLSIHMSTPAALRGKFSQRFGSIPRIYRAPGRINLIGEHTDYNDGFVFPAAIEFHTWVAVAPRQDKQVVVYSENFQETAGFRLGSIQTAKHHWSDYVCGVALLLEREGHQLQGADLLIQSNIPIGSGLSSSAAIEVATALALLGNSGHSISPLKLAQLCQRAENEFVGARCGIMDQFVCCHAKADHALMLDCRSLDYSLAGLSSDYCLVACNTMVKHNLAAGEYNQRRAQCEEGVRRLAAFVPEIRALRDISLEQLQKHASNLPEVVYRRCRHVITENDRVIAASSSLKVGDWAGFGRLMAESHRSLREDYEVSCIELDVMVEIAGRIEGVLGARMTGGGFGGCTVNLVCTSAVEQFSATVAKEYEAKIGHRPEIYVSRAVAGAEEVV